MRDDNADGERVIAHLRPPIMKSSGTAGCVAAHTRPNATAFPRVRRIGGIPGALMRHLASQCAPRLLPNAQKHEGRSPRAGRLGTLH